MRIPQITEKLVIHVTYQFETLVSLSLPFPSFSAMCYLKGQHSFHGEGRDFKFKIIITLSTTISVC